MKRQQPVRSHHILTGNISLECLSAGVCMCLHMTVWPICPYLTKQILQCVAVIKINKDCESECCLAGHLYPCSLDLNLILTERGERERSLQRLLIQHCSYGLAYLLQACLWAAVYCISKREIKCKHIKWLPLLCPHLKDTGQVWSINPIVNANGGNYSEVLLEKSFLAFLLLLLIQENKREPGSGNSTSWFQTCIEWQALLRGSGFGCLALAALSAHLP